MTEFGSTNLDPDGTFQIPIEDPRPGGLNYIRHVTVPLYPDRVGIFFDGVEYANSTVPIESVWTSATQALEFRLTGSTETGSYFDTIDIGQIYYRMINVFLVKNENGVLQQGPTYNDSLTANAIWPDDPVPLNRKYWWHYNRDFQHVGEPSTFGGWGLHGQAYFGRARRDGVGPLSGTYWSGTVDSANLKLAPWQPYSDGTPVWGAGLWNYVYRPMDIGVGFDNTVGNSLYPLDQRYWPVPDYGESGSGFTHIVAQVELWRDLGVNIRPRYHVYTLKTTLPIPSGFGGTTIYPEYPDVDYLHARFVDNHHHPESGKTLDHRNSGVTYIVADNINTTQITITGNTGGDYGGEFWRFPGQNEIFNQAMGGYYTDYYDGFGLDTSRTIEFGYGPISLPYDPYLPNACSNSIAYNSSLMTPDVVSVVVVSGTVVNDHVPSNSGTFATDLTILHTKIYGVELQVSNDSGITWNDNIITPPRWNNVAIRPNIDLINSDCGATIHYDIDYGDGETYSAETQFLDSGLSGVLYHNYYRENERFDLSLTAYTLEYSGDVYTDHATVTTSQLINVQYPGLAYHWTFDGNCIDRNGNTRARTGETNYTFENGYIGSAITNNGTAYRVELEEPIYCLQCLSHTGLTFSAFTLGNNFEWTIACWTKLSSGMSASQFNYVLSLDDGNNANDKYAFGFFSGASAKRIMIGKNNPIDSDMPQYDWPEERWFHAMWVQKDGVVDFYENGIWSLSGTLFEYNYLIDTDRSSGSTRPWLAYKYYGSISDLRIYNRALNTHEKIDIVRANTFNMKFNTSSITANTSITSSNYFDSRPSIEYTYIPEYNLNGTTKFFTGASYGYGYVGFTGGAPGYDGLEYSAVNNTVGTSGNVNSTIQFYANIPEQGLPWVSVTDEQNIVAIVDSSDAKNKSIGVYSADTGKIQLVYDWSGGNASSFEYVIPNEWHLYALTFSAVSYSPPEYTIKWYRDGIEQKSTSYTTVGYPPRETSTSRVLIGGEGGQYSKSFSGAIGEVKLWNTCLSPTDILNEHKRIMTIDEHGNIETLEFDEKTSASNYRVDATDHISYFEELNEIGPTSGLVGYFTFNSNSINYAEETGATVATLLSNPDGYERFYSCGGFGNNTNQSLYVYADSGVNHSIVLDSLTEGQGGPLSSETGTFFSFFKGLQVSGTNFDDRFDIFSVEGSGDVDQWGVSLEVGTLSSYNEIKLWLGSYSTILSSATISIDSDWHGISVTWNTTDEIVIYLDDQKVMSYPNLKLSTMLYGANAFENQDFSDLSTSCIISKMQLYNRNLSHEEIAQIYGVNGQQVKIDTNGVVYTSHNIKEK